MVVPTRIRHLLRTWCFIGAVASTAGCFGESRLEFSPTTPAGADDAPADVSPELRCQDTADVQVEVAPLLRLTREQYERTVTDLLGPGGATGALPGDPVTAQFPEDDQLGGFELGGTVSELLVEQQWVAAERLAAASVPGLQTRYPCDVAALGEAACAKDFITRFGRRAYRRPLRPEEVARFEAVFAAGREGASYAEGLQLVVEAALMSPRFQYHLQQNPVDAAPGDVVPVRGYELASRLSYLLWNSMPDDALLDAAEAGQLDTEEGFAVQAARMIDDPRAHDGFDNFFRQWLAWDKVANIDRDLSVYPEFSRELAVDLRGSLKAFVHDVIWNGDARLHTLMSSPEVFLNERLSAVYGGGVVGDALAKVTLPHRQGLLTQPALMAALARPNQSDPIHRGIFVRTHLLCQELPAPPPDVELVIQEPTPGLTTRERFAEHSTNVQCSGCHQLIDPIGFGFENFDGIGRYRELDDGEPVDARGEVVKGGDASGKFEGVPQLADKLMQSEEVARCISRTFLRYALARSESASDECSVEGLVTSFAETEGNLRSLMLAVTRTQAFRFRRVDVAGEAP